MNDIEKAIKALTGWSSHCQSHNKHIFELEDLELNEEVKKIFDISISAIQELERYRSLEERLKSVYGDCEGLLERTVESLIQYNVTPEIPVKTRLLTDGCVDMWEQYKSIGTPEECQKAVKKQKAKKPTYDGDGYAPDGSFVWDNWICPHCGSRFEVDFDEYEYCPNCGQHIDWGE